MGVDVLQPPAAAAGASVDVSDRAGRLLGIVASIAAPVDVSDRAARALGVVAAITAAVDVSDRAARLLGVTSRTPASLNQTVTGGANAIATATLPAVAGQFHYITHISIRRVATAALAGGAILAVTTTNLGARSWRTGNQASILADTFDEGLLMEADYSHPLKSTVANTATTIVCPAAGAAVSWQINVDYYTAP